MGKCAYYISVLESHPSRLDKEAIIKTIADEGNTEFFEGCRLALDPMITFGIKQVKEKIDADGPGLPWDSFTLVITGFVTREVTGNTARNMLDSMMKSATKEEWNGWYRRILIKDLRCGVSEKTINKVVGKKYGHYAIPIFGCQLAHDSANHDTKVTGKKILETKLDGVRVITIVRPTGVVDQFSRNGKELVNFPHVKEQFASIASKLSEPWVFDGEIMSSSFQDLMKQVHRKSNVKANDAVLNLFDCLSLTDFEAGKSNIKQTDRSLWLQKWYIENEKSLPNITVVGQVTVDLDTDKGQETLRQINHQAVSDGYEGIMFKDPDAIYECKRSVAWLKLKPFIEVSLEVIGVEEGTGRNLGRLGALVCSGQDDGRDIVVNVGSGFGDSDRDQFWSARDAVVGQIVEVRADAITKNQDGSYSLRFPRFLRFRGFEIGEKI
jgi:DNA ligase-1